MSAQFIGSALDPNENCHSNTQRYNLCVQAHLHARPHRQYLRWRGLKSTQATRMEIAATLQPSLSLLAHIYMPSLLSAERLIRKCALNLAFVKRAY